MKKISICIMLAVTMSGCMAEQHVWTKTSTNWDATAPKKIAIFPISGDMTGAISDALTTELMGMGFEVVERSNINAILKEMKLDFSGVLSQDQKKEIARVSNANAIIFGSVQTTINGNIFLLDLRFIDITTGEILWSMNYLNKDISNPRQSMLDISESIQKGIGRSMSGLMLGDTQSIMGARLSIAQNTKVAGKKYKKVALLKLRGTQIYGEDDAAYGALVTDLIGNGVELVERKDFDSILKEQAANESGIYSQMPEQTGVYGQATKVSVSTTVFSREVALSKKNLLEISQITGADALLLGSFQPNMNNPFVFAFANLRVLDLETGRIAWSASYYNDPSMTEGYILASDWLAISLAPIITSENKEEFDNKYSLAFDSRKASESSIIEKLIPCDNIKTKCAERGYR